jgi:hypothetical protein
MEITSGLHRIQAAKQLARFESKLAGCEILPFDSSAALLAGRIDAELKRRGTTINLNDVMWLLAVQAGDVASKDVEPPVPPGLSDLTAAQAAMVEFLRIDEDLLTRSGSSTMWIAKCRYSSVCSRNGCAGIERSATHAARRRSDTPNRRTT